MEIGASIGPTNHPDEWMRRGENCNTISEFRSHTCFTVCSRYFLSRTAHFAQFSILSPLQKSPRSFYWYQTTGNFESERGAFFGDVFNWRTNWSSHDRKGPKGRKRSQLNKLKSDCSRLSILIVTKVVTPKKSHKVGRFIDTKLRHSFEINMQWMIEKGTTCLDKSKSHYWRNWLRHTMAENFPRAIIDAREQKMVIFWRASFTKFYKMLLFPLFLSLNFNFSCFVVRCWSPDGAGDVKSLKGTTQSSRKYTTSTDQIIVSRDIRKKHSHILMLYNGWLGLSWLGNSEPHAALDFHALDALNICTRSLSRFALYTFLARDFLWI